MYNCWNEALQYLIRKYGKKEITTGYHYQGGKSTTRKADTFNTDKPMDSTDSLMVVLMGQYYYGISAKKELYNILVSLGEIKVPENLEVSN